jgi:hypothetical protein
MVDLLSSKMTKVKKSKVLNTVKCNAIVCMWWRCKDGDRD